MNDITASSQAGASGTVTLNTLNIDPSRGLVSLPLNLADPAQQVTQGCSPNGRSSAKQGRFVISGRGGLPANPEDAFTGEQALTDLVALVPPSRNLASHPHQARTSQAERSQQPPTEIIEAQGWVYGTDGSLYLISQAANGILNAGWQSPVACPETTTNTHQ
jgi:large exoprotein involved in heme utilization and adhesion